MTYDWNSLIQNMEKQHVIIDGRNILDQDKISRVANKFIAIGK